MQAFPHPLPPPGRMPAVATPPRPSQELRKVLYAPIKLALVYLFGTYALFLASNLVGDVSNLGMLTTFVTITFVAFYVGFRAGIGNPARWVGKSGPQFGGTSFQRRLALVAALYFLIWSVNQFIDFGATSPADIVNRILTPGAAYKAKFDVYARRLDTNAVNPVTQVLILASILYAVFVPLLIAGWRNLGAATRVLGSLAVLAYIGCFLFIGTMKGVGDIALFALAGGSVWLAKHTLFEPGDGKRRRPLLKAAAAVALLLGYMAFNQFQRAQEFNIQESLIVGDVSRTAIARTLGQDAAFGIYSTLAYPSHGYRGLAISLDDPFVFSHGAGLSQAVESYRRQVLGGPDNVLLTYPFRGELASGWPSGLVWWTIFPWLASDLTFWGVPLFMALMGWVFARLWTACLFGNNPFALAAFGQMLIFVAFIPANNQVLMQRQGLWSVIWLLGIGAGHLLTSRRRR